MSERVKEMVDLMESRYHQEILKKRREKHLSSKRRGRYLDNFSVKLKEPDYVQLQVCILHVFLVLCQVQTVFQIRIIMCVTSAHRPSQQVTMGL
jgi:hypothetical protein